MKKLKHIVAAIVLLIPIAIGTGCDDSYLDMSNHYGQNVDTFYKTKADFDAALAGVYNTLYLAGGNVWAEEHITSSILSDEMLAGGGPNDREAKYVDGFTDPLDNTYQDLWKETYNGIFRANNIIEKLPLADFSSSMSAAEAEAYKNTILGETYFMRGFLLFRGAKFFGGMPLMTETTTPLDVPRATFSETFGQIAADLKQAISLMPKIDPSTISASEYGHANHWVAQAYLARVYLFYTGYMTNIENQGTDVFTLPDGSTITKQDVINELTDCMNNSGYGLVSDFRNLWPYSYLNESAGSEIYPWANSEGLSWAGQDGFNSTVGTGNNEVMFALRYAFSDWGWAKGDRTHNRAALFFAIRIKQVGVWGQGWGFGMVHPTMFAQWDNADPRKMGSVLQMGEAAEGTESYDGPSEPHDHNTWLYNKKYIGLQYDGEGLFEHIYGVTWPDFQRMNAQDFFYMRFADVLLMHSELTGTADGMNLVRERAGLAPVAYSLAALKQERLHELAFEGLRWFDLVRWGDVTNGANNFFDDVITVESSGGPTSYSVLYRPETKGLVSIPESEILLSNGVYQQNPGWE